MAQSTEGAAVGEGCAASDRLYLSSGVAQVDPGEARGNLSN